MTIANGAIAADNKEVVRRLYEECLNGRNFASAAVFIAGSFVAPIGSGPGGARPSGKSVRQSAIVIYQLAHRKVIAVWLMVDRLGLAQQLGPIAGPNGGLSSPHAGTSNVSQ